MTRGAAATGGLGRGGAGGGSAGGGGLGLTIWIALVGRLGGMTDRLGPMRTRSMIALRELTWLASVVGWLVGVKSRGKRMANERYRRRWAMAGR